MKIKGYKNFEAIRDDEFSYLNDELDQFNKMGNRWDDSTYMEDDNYRYDRRYGWEEEEEEEGFIDYDIYSDSDLKNKTGSNRKYKEEDDLAMNELLGSLEDIFINSGINDVILKSDVLDIIAYFTLSYKNRSIDYLIEILDVCNYIKDEILVNYYTEIEFDVSKDFKDIMIVNFYYTKDDKPF